MDHTFAWPDQIQGAVSLTYDDGLPIHYTLADLLLRQHSLRAVTNLGITPRSDG